MKNKNDCNVVLKKNEDLTSKLDFVLKENESLKNNLISKKLDLVSKKNVALKNDVNSHVCHAPLSSIPIACSIIENDICALKKSVDCLGSTLSQCLWIIRN